MNIFLNIRHINFRSDTIINTFNQNQCHVFFAFCSLSAFSLFYFFSCAARHLSCQNVNAFLICVCLSSYASFSCKQKEICGQIMILILTPTFSVNGVPRCLQW